MKVFFLFPALLAFAHSLTFGSYQKHSALHFPQQPQSHQETSQQKSNFISLQQFEGESHKRWETRPQTYSKTERQSPQQIRYDEQIPFLSAVQQASLQYNPKVQDSVSYLPNKSFVYRQSDKSGSSDGQKGNQGKVLYETAMSNSTIISKPIGIQRKAEQRDKANGRDLAINENGKAAKIENQSRTEGEKINNSALAQPTLKNDASKVNKTVVTTVTTVLTRNTTGPKAVTSNSSNVTGAQRDLPTSTVVTTTTIVNTTNQTLINGPTNSSTTNASAKQQNITSNKSLNSSNSSDLKQSTKLPAIFEKHKGEEVLIVFGCYHNNTELQRDTCGQEKVCEGLWQKYKKECELQGKTMVVADLTGRKYERHNLKFWN